MTRVRAATAIARTLAELGVTHMFGLIGDANFEIADDSFHHAGISFVPAKHESAAVAMADTYARVTGRPGVATVTRGPGVTNAVTGLLEAWKAGTPLLLITGDIEAGVTDDPQLIDQNGLWRSLSIPVLRYHGPQLAAADVARGLRRAVAEHTPVVFSMPGDHQSVEVEYQPVPEPRVAARAAAPSAGSLDEVVASIERARNPVILGGWGVACADAEKTVRTLGDRIGSLFATTAAAHGLFGDSDWHLGVSGGFSTSLARELLADADLVLAFGAALNHWTTRRGSLYDGATVYLFNDRSRPVSEDLPRDTTIVQCDVGLAAEHLLRRIDGLELGVAYRRPEIASRIANWDLGRTFEDRSVDGYVDPRSLLLALDRLLPADRVIVTDCGHATTFPYTFLRARGARGSIFSQYYLSVGLGLANLVGAAVGADGRCVVSIVGDGGALMSLGEMATIATRTEPILVVVMNDRAYGVELHLAAKHRTSTDLVTFPTTDFAAVARAFGIRAHVVQSVADLGQIDDWAQRPHGPLLLDCRVNRDVRAPFMEELR